MSIENIMSYASKKDLESYLTGFSLLKEELDEKISIMALSQKFNHAYKLNDWLHAIYEMAYSQQKYDVAMAYCQDVLDTFKDDRYVCDFYAYKASAQAKINMEAALEYLRTVLKQYPNETVLLYTYVTLLESSNANNIVEEIQKYVPLTLEHNVETAPLIQEVTKILKRKDENLAKSYNRIQRNQEEFGKRKPQTKTVTVGRNDPCPCGSGKKYKKCCGK